MGTFADVLRVTVKVVEATFNRTAEFQQYEIHQSTTKNKVPHEYIKSVDWKEVIRKTCILLFEKILTFGEKKSTSFWYFSGVIFYNFYMILLCSKVTFNFIKHKKVRGITFHKYFTCQK